MKVIREFEIKDLYEDDTVGNHYIIKVYDDESIDILQDYNQMVVINKRMLRHIVNVVDEGSHF